MGGIIRFEVNGRQVLGFDTGLDSKAFAQTKSAQLITLPGWLVSPDGNVALWKLEGVIEREGTMVVWAHDFAGERLDSIILDNTRKDEALDALRYWIRARITLGEMKSVESLPAPWPVGAFIDPQGTTLFPPDQLIRQTIEAESKEVWRNVAECWVHPDLTDLEASIFAAGTMSYRIFSGSSPFPNQDVNILWQDLREGVFFPLALEAPGLDKKLSALITSAIEAFTQNQQQKNHRKSAPPTLNELKDYLGDPGSTKAEAYFYILSEEEQTKLSLELERFRKKQNLTVKTKRFVIRNTTILAVIAASIVGLGLVVRSFVIEKANRPTTKGMQPIEVVESYYTAIGDLDHTLMEACVMGKAGKNDIEMVINYFVLSKVRQAYEINAPMFISAQKWLDAGSPDTEATVFGISNLLLSVLDADESDGEVLFKASYQLWHPQSPEDNPESETLDKDEAEKAAAFPINISFTDTVRLSLHKDAWRITELERITEE
ncbi:MAG: hypothetical protein LBD29_00445 [Treponema sp.]|jgi:hypothetical protein|nr:hypothetical protein [Treponema sp.]